MDADVAEAAAALRADLALLDTGTKEAAALLDLVAWQLGELGRQAAPMTSKTLALARARQNIQAARAASEEVLEHLDASRKMQGVIDAGPRANLEAFLAALERLEVALDFLQAHRSMQSAEDALRHTAALRDRGLAAAGAEFAALLAKHAAVPPALLARLRAAAEAGAASGHSRAAAAAAGGSGALDLLPEPVLAKLRALAAAMLHNGGAAGGRSCIRAYADVRRSVLVAALEPHLAPLGGSREELGKLTWQQMETKIPGWVAALRLFVRLAQEEARLCAAVYPAGEQAAVLSQVAAACGASLLDAADVVLAARRTPEKMFGLLDMLDGVEAALPLLRAALAVAVPRLDRTSVGAGDAPAAAAQLMQLRGRLAAEVRACWGDLPDWLGREAAKGVPADGAVHPVCATTMALLKRTLAYESALPVLFGEGAAAGGAGAGVRGGGGLAEEAGRIDRMAAATAHILDKLLAALDAKAKASYKHRALAALHQMNNAAHVCHALGSSRELRVVGEGWLEQDKGAVEEHQRAYVEAAWGPLLSLLRADAREALPPNLASDRAARQAVKDKWSAVNKALGEAQAQQGWAVPDGALRNRVRDELVTTLAPLYDAFCAKYVAAPYTDNHAKHERTAPVELRELLEQLFERAEAGGAAGLVGRSPSRSPGSSAGLTRRLSGLGRTP